MKPVVHSCWHAVTGVAIWEASRAASKGRRAAWCCVAALSTALLHRDHHPRVVVEVR